MKIGNLPTGRQGLPTEGRAATYSPIRLGGQYHLRRRASGWEEVRPTFDSNKNLYKTKKPV